MFGPSRAERVARANAQYYRHLEAGYVRRHLDMYEMSLAGKRVLDLGCGPGHYLVEVSKDDPARLVGVEANPDRLNYARTELARRGIDKAELVPNASDYLPFEAASFDVVLCFLTIPFFDDDEVALREIARVLAPGGTLLLSAHGLGFPLPYLRRMKPKMMLLYATTAAYLVTGKKLVQNTLQLVGQTKHRLEEAGFRVERVSTRDGLLGLPETFTVKAFRVT